jgi:signal transduction histidine kinase
MLSSTSQLLESFRLGIEPYLPKAFRQGTMTWVFVISLVVIFALVPSTMMDMEVYGNAPGWVGIPSLVFLLYAINKGMPLRWAVNIFLMISALSLMYCATLTAGIYSLRNVWLLLLPMAPYYFQGPRVGWMWAAFITVIFMVIGYMTHFHHAAEVMPSPQGLMTSSWAATSAVTLLMLVIPLVYQVSDEVMLRDKQIQLDRLTQQKNDLERSQAERDRFIASVSHELRTPMNAILGLNEWLLGQVKDNPQAMRLLKQTRLSADHLMTVINDVLDYSQLQSGKIVLHRVITPLHQCAQDAFSVLEQSAQNKGLLYELRIHPDVPHLVELDRHRLVQVLVNLLGNAVKFTAKGAVTLELMPAEGGGVLFVVTDSGIGISPEQQRILFNRFAQADLSIQERFGGSGLGLVISQSLVQWMGGRLALQSQTGQGSRFSFTLPLKQVAVSPHQAEPQVSDLKTLRWPVRFLVVDDHAVNRLLVQRRLKTTWPQAQVIELVDGAQAVAWLQDHECDLIFMDMLMPVMDGIEATHRIRQLPNPQTANTLVVGLTANVNAQDLGRFQEAGLNGLHLKPYDWAELCKEVDDLLMARSIKT